MYKSSPDESIIASRKIGESNSIDVSRQLISEKFKSYSSFSEDIKKHITLLIADRKPVERRWFIIPTILVVAFLGVVGLHAGIIGLIPLIRGILTLVVAVILLSILIYSYLISRDLT